MGSNDVILDKDDMERMRCITQSLNKIRQIVERFAVKLHPISIIFLTPILRAPAPVPAPVLARARARTSLSIFSILEDSMDRS